MKCYNDKIMRKIIFITFLVTSLLITSSVCFAQPYGIGKYNATVPYGGQTSLSIATDGNVSIPINPSTGGLLATGTSTVTVTSTDVIGYKLYVRALNNTNMVNGGNTLPTSANGSPAALAVNTWGYNTDASGNFVGMTLSDVLIKSVTSPASTGDVTNITYGINIDLLKPTGQYTTSVIYTAVPQTN